MFYVQVFIKKLSMNNEKTIINEIDSNLRNVLDELDCICYLYNQNDILHFKNAIEYLESTLSDVHDYLSINKKIDI